MDVETRIAELAADKQELSALITLSGRKRVTRVLRSWLARAEKDEDQLRSSGASGRGSAPAAPAAADCQAEKAAQFAPPPRGPDQQNSDLPVVLLLGAEGTGTRRLLCALTNHGLGDFEADAPVMVNATIETKYYTARVQYRIIDTEADVPNSDTLALIENASALLFFWDVARPETFVHVRKIGDALNFAAEGDSSQDGGVDRVQLCVAVEGPGAGDAAGPPASDAAGAALAWCAENCFEHLSCPLSDADLKAVRQRFQAAAEGSFGGLLDSETDDNALRIVEALECHAWPGLERRAPPVAPRAGREAAPDEEIASLGTSSPSESPLPTVVVVGAMGLGKRSLVRALAGTLLGTGTCGNNAVAEAVLETKYYSAQIRFRVLDVPIIDVGAQLTEVDDIRSASAIILVWDPAHPETWAGAQQAHEAHWPQASDNEVCGADDAGTKDRSGRSRAGPVRLCVAAGDRAAPRGAKAEAVFNWCIEHSFEYLQCELGDAALEALARRWRDGSMCGTPLLATDEGTNAERIVEALECHAWPGLKWKQRPALGEGASAEVGATVDQLHAEQAASESAPGAGRGREKAAAAVESMEGMAEEMRQVREMTDEGRRRERACELAMRLAESLGEDSD